MQTIPSKMEVNAAIENLIEAIDDFTENAKIVIAYGDRLKKDGAFPLEREYVTPSPDGEEEKTRYAANGVFKDKVGNYRLRKNKEGLLTFNHFKHSDVIRIEEDGANVFSLEYDPKTLEPKCFGLLVPGKRYGLKLLKWTLQLQFIKVRKIDGPQESAEKFWYDLTLDLF